jgi:hypothetical protein
MFAGAHVKFDYSKLVIEVSIPSWVYDQFQSLDRLLHTSGSFLTSSQEISRSIMELEGSLQFSQQRTAVLSEPD